LIAYFTSEQATDETALDLQSYVKQKLPNYMVPSDFVWLECLPINASGKVDRMALPAPDQARPISAENFCAPRTTVERALANIWSELLDVERVGVNENFFELGGHSMLAVRLMARIQELFGQELSLSALFQSPTIEHLGQILEQESESKPWSHLVAIQPSGSKRPFFCVHPAGGQVFCYYQLSRHLGNDQPFYAFEAPDFLTIGESGEQYSGIEERAATYLEALQLVQPTGPYLIGGWSFGGIVAFEMAQRLRRRGEEVALLAIIDSIAPVIATELDDAKLIVGFALEAAAQAGQSLALTTKQLEGLKVDEQLDYVVERLRQAAILPTDVRQEIAVIQARRVLEGSKLRSQSITSYVPQPYPGPITVFTAELNPGWSEDGSVSEIVKLYQDPTKGWSTFSAMPVRAIAIPGYHATLLFEPHVHTLAQHLRTCIEEVNGSSH
jgi:thioesterase domain-containing protein/acyl carrier protein